MAAKVVRVDAQVQWKVSRTQNGNYLAVCDPLKLSIQAGTWSEMSEDIALALDALIRDLVESNEINPFLREQGWRMLGAIPRGRQLKNVRFDVPFIPIPAMTGYGGAHAVS